MRGANLRSSLEPILQDQPENHIKPGRQPHCWGRIARLFGMQALADDMHARR